MRIFPKKSFKLLFVCLITYGAMGMALPSVHAKHRHYKYRTHRHVNHHRRSVNRYGRWVKIRRHGKRRLIWRRYKSGYYHRGHWVRYRRHQSQHRRLARLASVRNANPEYHYSNTDENSMDNITQMEFQTIKMINVDRAAHNLPPLRETVALKQLAKERAQQSAELDYLTHKDPQGRNYYEKDAKWMRIHLGDYSGENIASAGLGPILMDDNPHVYNNGNGKDMADMDEDEMINHDSHSNWSHRYNTLNSHYKYVGIGAKRKANTNNYYLAENFSS